jgi:hypothetical protein
LAKKQKRASAAVQKFRQKKFDPDTFPFLTPIAFGVLLFGMVILFDEFIFSDKIFFSPDMLSAGLFFRSFYVNFVRAHASVPQWNPYIFGGLPFVEAFHGDIFYPLSFLKFFGSLFRSLGYNLILHIFLSGIFTYFCARQFKLSKLASLLSGISYMFAGYLVSQIGPVHDGKIYVTSLFPLTIFFLDRAFEKEPFFNFSLLALVIGLIILVPHPQMAYFSLWSISVYSLFKLVVVYREQGSIKPVIRLASLTTYAVVIGLLLSAVQFYPGYYYTTHYSPRSEVKRGWEWATSWSLHEEEAFSLLIPEFAGANTQKARTYYWGKNAFKDNSETVGIVCLFSALIGLFFYRKKESYFLGGLALFALIYALGATTPFFRLFFYLIPMVKSLRAPSMIMFLFSFSIAILAGMGLQFVIEHARELKGVVARRFRYLLLGMPGLMLLLALLFSIFGKQMLNLWTSLFYGDAATTMVQEGVSKLDVAYLNLPAIQSGAWLGFLFTALAALCIWIYQTGKAGVYVLVALLLIPAVDGIRFNKRFINVVDPSPYLSPNVVSEFLKKDTGKYRVQDFTQNASINLPLHGIEVVTGYHGNQLKWYDKLLGGLSLRNLANPRFLNLVGAKYIIIPPKQKLLEGALGDKSTTTVLNFGSGQVIRNDNAFPRVFLVDRYKIVDDVNEIYSQVINGAEDLRQIVYLEEDPGIKPSPDSMGSDSTWIIDYESDSVLIGLSCTKNHILVITDNYYEAWQAYVDARPAKQLRAYSSFRAVAVPAGTQKVLFKYKSERYITGRLITWLTSVYLLIVLGFYVVKSRLVKGKRKKSSNFP